MQTLILAIFCCVIVTDFIVQSLALPPLTRMLPEMMSGIVIVYVLVAGTRDRFRWVAPKYWFVFAALAITILCGIINGGPGAGPVISGTRFYLRAAPLFFLAAVLPISDEQLKRQLKLLLGLALVQLPLALYQRWIVYSEERYSGDPVQGTLGDSGILSMFLICGVLLLTGLVLKRRIGWVPYGILIFLLLFPTTINETKVTVIFLPVGLFMTLIVAADPGKRLRYAGLALVILVTFGAIFVPIYNMTQQRNHYKVDIIDFFTHEEELDKYLAGSGHATGLGTTKMAHRGEAMVFPIKYLSKDPALLAFGLGLGNVSPSTIGKNFQGAYYALFQSFLVISFAYFVLELGLLGVSLILVLFWLVFWDSFQVARTDDSLTGAIAAGWTGVVVVFLIAMFYNSFHYFTSVTFLYSYFSGVICARRMAMRRDPARVLAQPAPHSLPAAA